MDTMGGPKRPVDARPQEHNRLKKKKEVSDARIGTGWTELGPGNGEWEETYLLWWI